jgi:adenylosuccinate lyase
MGFTPNRSPLALSWRGGLAEVCRNRDRILRLRQEIAVGKISGAVGTYANIDPKVEANRLSKFRINT